MTNYIDEENTMGFKAPLVGEWYSDVLNGQIFEVVAFDDHAATIEIQYVEGELSEIEAENWVGMNLDIVAAPEDWAASYEIAPEDSDANEATIQGSQDPLATIEPESMLGFDEFY